MNIKNLAMIGGALLLAGCPGGGSTDTPIETGDTDIATVPPAAFEWNITLTDGDQVGDGTGGFDNDTTAVETVNSVANYPSIVEWEFGYAQTESVGGWTGEDCDGVVTQGQDICHLFAPDTTMTLTRVATIPEIVQGSTTLNNVDFPEANTPGITYIIFGYDDATPANTVECFVQGDSATYYNALNCDPYTPAM